MPSMFIRSAEIAIGAHKDLSKYFKEEELQLEQVRFVAELVDYCRQFLFYKNKIRRPLASKLESAWEVSQGYLEESMGRFSVDQLSEFIKANSVVRKVTLSVARYILDVSLLHRLITVLASKAALKDREAGLVDLARIVTATKADWQAYLVQFEDRLNSDPCGIYAQMDAESKDTYRDRIAAISIAVRVPENDVADQMLALARNSTKSPANHVGYYLIGDGAPALYATFGRKFPRRQKLISMAPILSYLVLRNTLASFILVVCFILMSGTSEMALPVLSYFCLLTVLAVEAVKDSVELLLGGLSTKRPSVALDFLTKGLADNCAVLVAVPLHLVNIAQWDRALATARLNLARANDTNVAVVFLTDFPDATSPGDSPVEQELLSYAVKSVEAISLSRPDGFNVFLLHRDRTFVAAQGAWIGIERKRGKLHQLNNLILGKEPRFSVASRGAIAGCSRSKYILCLDEDSQIGRDAVQRMAGFLAHPLNLPRIAEGTVRSGHALASPCTMTNAASLSTWRWPRFSVGSSANPSAKLSATRNFMYDWFGQAPYSGKGMFEPVYFENLCANRIPENKVLSHDTLEAGCLRPGYVDNALITDTYPSSFRSFFERQDRWIRGDLQNAAIASIDLIKPSSSVPAITIFTIANQLLAWLSNAAVFAVFGLLIVFDCPFRWYLLAFLVMMLGGYQRFLMNWIRDSAMPKDQKLSVYLPYFVRIHLAQILRLAISPLNAFQLMRAVIVTFWRLLMQRNLLQWRAAAVVEFGQTGQRLFASIAWGVSVLAIIGVIVGLNRQMHWVGVVILVAWAFAPSFNILLTRSTR